MAKTVLLFESDLRSSQIITQFLNHLGYQSVLYSQSVENTQELILKLTRKIDLIIFSSTEKMDSESHHNFFNLIAQNRNLDLVPLMFIKCNQTPLFSLKNKKPIHFRIDHQLLRPFSLSHFSNGIIQAHQSRWEQRNHILVLNHSFIESNLFAKKTDLGHWTQLHVFTDSQSFIEYFDTNKTKIGALILDPKSCDENITNWCLQLKKKTQDRSLPMVFLSRDPSLIQKFRLIGDLYIDHPQSSTTKLKSTSSMNWEELLSLISKRVLNAWPSRDLIMKTRRFIKTKPQKNIPSLLKKAFKLDENRWEFLLLAGLFAEKQGQRIKAINYFRNTLNFNPCAPLPYLKLVQLVDSPQEHKKLLHLALQYCPHHPQIQSLVSQFSSRGTLQ